MKLNVTNLLRNKKIAQEKKRAGDLTAEVRYALGISENMIKYGMKTTHEIPNYKNDVTYFPKIYILGH